MLPSEVFRVIVQQEDRYSCCGFTVDDANKSEDPVAETTELILMLSRCMKDEDGLLVFSRPIPVPMAYVLALAICLPDSRAALRAFMREDLARITKIAGDE